MPVQVFETIDSSLWATMIEMIVEIQAKSANPIPHFEIDRESTEERRQCFDWLRTNGYIMLKPRLSDPSVELRTARLDARQRDAIVGLQRDWPQLLQWLQEDEIV